MVAMVNRGGYGGPVSLRIYAATGWRGRYEGGMRAGGLLTIDERAGDELG